MADMAPHSPLDAVLQPGAHGPLGADGPGITFRERRELAVVSLMIGPERRTAVAEALDGIGLALPAENAAAECGGTLVLWAALDRWHVLAEETGQALLHRLHAVVGTQAALVDQTAGTCPIEVTGPAVRSLLEKSTPIDLDHFEVGATAATSINHLGVHLWRQAQDRYLISVQRSFARDLLEFLHTMALDLGYADVR